MVAPRRLRNGTRCDRVFIVHRSGDDCRDVVIATAIFKGGIRMSTIHMHATTTSTPEQSFSALIDFGPGRSKIFGNSADDYLKVYHRGLSETDVTEGSGGVWERLHYDWSDPTRVVMKTTDSNIWGGRSGHVYTFPRRTDGITDAVVSV